MDYITVTENGPNDYLYSEFISITSSGTAEKFIFYGKSSDDGERFQRGSDTNHFLYQRPFIQLKRLFICNTDNTDITVNLWLDDETNEFYLLKGLTIKQGTTLDFNDGIPFDLDTVNNLKLNLGDAGHTADVTAIFCVKNYSENEQRNIRRK